MNDPSDASREPAEIVDARGLYCPVPLLRLKRRVRHVPAGVRVVLLATDPTVLRDVPAFCLEEGHGYLGHASTPDGTIEVSVRTGPPQPFPG